MPWIEITKQTVCGGKRVKVGDVVEASARDAQVLKGYRKAIDAEKPTPRKKKVSKRAAD